ncbi:MAG: hypothetical protein A2Y48_08435 [Nitrospirae bacterium RIFCSPLOW2_12_42_9]|nr:MAG: hypothetical protein A2035_08460 [Nitrospirae bacterium GWA2_42_11]OGW58267.1 MAG: hypothetical protein A2Y48_08435 [Nitrospirae bacterium RIFCSPLOW2_12_42_9]HBI23222.1 hypothetical protein [Nitrospiraceae bacterium]
MKVIIEIEKDEEFEKIKKALKGEAITIVKSRSEREKILEAIFKKYNVSLPKNYKFNREEIHAR